MSSTMDSTTPGLVVIGGLPATGKTSIARPLARLLGAAYLRIDTIENALVRSGEVPHVEQAGYITAYAVARDQVGNGLVCVAECVNPIGPTRDAWREVALAQRVWLVEVELICADRVQHRARVEGRVSDLPNLVLPTWQQVVDREYEPWNRERLVIDTSVIARDTAVDIVRRRVVAEQAQRTPDQLR